MIFVLCNSNFLTFTSLSLITLSFWIPVVYGYTVDTPTGVSWEETSQSPLPSYVLDFLWNIVVSLRNLQLIPIFNLRSSTEETCSCPYRVLSDIVDQNLQPKTTSPISSKFHSVQRWLLVELLKLGQGRTTEPKGRTFDLFSSLLKDPVRCKL